MDPKEELPESQKNPNGVSNLSQLFAQVDSDSVQQEQNTKANFSSSTTPISEDFGIHIPDSTTSEPSIKSPSATENIQTQVDPKLLASTLEDKWSDDALPASQKLLQQQVAQSSQQSPSQVKPQIIEKIIYKKQRVHGFFRTLALIALLFVGVLMLLEGLKIFSLNIARLDMNIFYPVFIILSVIVIWSYKGLFGKIFGSLMFLGVVAGFFVVSVYTSLSSTIKNNTGSLVSFPLFSGSSYSKIYVSTLINSLSVGSQTGLDLLSSNYDIARPLISLSGHVPGSHTYAIIQESDSINLLDGLYSRLNIGLQAQSPIYLYVKTLIGQNTLDMTNVLVRGLRVHGGILSLDITLGSGQVSVSKTPSLLGNTKNLITTGSALSGEVVSGKVSSGVDMLFSGIVVAITSGVKNNIDLDLQAAVADVTLHLPKTIGVRMHYKSYLGVSDFPQIIQKPDGRYESKNIGAASTVLDINALFGLSRLTIVRDR